MTRQYRLGPLSLRSVHTDRSDSDFVSDFDVGSIGMYSNIIGIGHFIRIGIGQCECTVILPAGEGETVYPSSGPSSSGGGGGGVVGLDSWCRRVRSMIWG